MTKKDKGFNSPVENIFPKKELRFDGILVGYIRVYKKNDGELSILFKHCSSKQGNFLMRMDILGVIKKIIQADLVGDNPIGPQYDHKLDVFTDYRNAPNAFFEYGNLCICFGEDEHLIDQ